MTSLQEIENHRNSFLKGQPKYGKLALEKAKNVSNYKELSKEIGCSETHASTILNQLLTYELYEKGKNGKYKRTKALRTVGLTSKKVITETNEKKIKVKKRKKINTTQIKKHITDYFQENFQKINNPFNESVKITLNKTKLTEATELFFEILDNDMGLDRLEGLGIRFYESIAGYFGVDRMKKSEMTVSFSSLITNFEPYIKKLAFYKTKDEKNTKLSLGKELIKTIMEFQDDLNKSDSEYWKDKSVKNSCIRHTFPFRHIEAHESRDWNVPYMEKAIFYMFSSIILINIDLKKDISKQK